MIQLSRRRFYAILCNTGHSKEMDKTMALVGAISQFLESAMRSIFTNIPKLNTYSVYTINFWNQPMNNSRFVLLFFLPEALVPIRQLWSTYVPAMLTLV